MHIKTKTKNHKNTYEPKKQRNNPKRELKKDFVRMLLEELIELPREETKK